MTLQQYFIKLHQHEKAITDSRLCPSIQSAAIVYQDKVKQCDGPLVNMLEITVPMSTLPAQHTIWPNIWKHYIIHETNSTYCIAVCGSVLLRQQCKQKVSWALDMWFWNIQTRHPKRSTTMIISVSVSINLQNHTSVLPQFFYARGSVPFCWYCNMLCISGFMYDIMFARNGWEQVMRKGHSQCGNTYMTLHHIYSDRSDIRPHRIGNITYIFLHLVPQKGRRHTHGDISCQFLTDFQNSFAGWFSSKFAVKRSLKIPTLLAYVATLPCETLMSESKRLAINYKVQ